MPRPHDCLFKFTFADVLETECLLRSLLPQPLAVLLRAATLETVPSRAAGPGLGRGYAGRGARRNPET